LRRRSPPAFERFELREENIMRTQHLLTSSIAVLLLVLAAQTAVAQQPAPNEVAREAERRAADLERERAQAAREAQRAERERELEEEREERREEERERQREQQTERASLEQDLEEARRELQQAAQDVARLSGELAAPFVDGVARGFRFAGQRAMLGVSIEDTERGVRVASVSPNGPAADAGLKVGDTITEIDGAALADTRVAGGGKQSPSELLFAQMANVDPGESVKLRVLNENGAERDATVTARDISPRFFAGSRNPLPSFKGPNSSYSYNYGGPGNWLFRNSSPWSQMQVIALTPALGKYFGTDKGLLVVRGPESAELGLRDGDVILDIGGREPTTPEHAIRILGSFAPDEALKITIMREQRRQTLDVKIPVEPAGWR
jgi:C-terminal processing protease CtpA/Prc